MSENTETFMVTRLGCASYSDGLTLAEAFHDLEVANRTVQPGHQIFFERDLSDDRVRALSDEAAAHGDSGMVAVCRRALAGDNAARLECEAVIISALAMESNQ